MSTGDPGNPFQSPTAEPSSYSSGIDPSTRTVAAMRATRPWVLFLAIMGALVTVIMLGCFVFQAITAISLGLNLARTASILGVAGVFLLLYGLPTIFLFRYAARLKSFVALGSINELDEALEAQKSFWKTVGIIVAIVMVIYGSILGINWVGLAGGF